MQLFKQVASKAEQVYGHQPQLLQHKDTGHIALLPSMHQGQAQPSPAKSCCVVC
jgi:hypothetical protein